MSDYINKQWIQVSYPDSKKGFSWIPLQKIERVSTSSKDPRGNGSAIVVSAWLNGIEYVTTECSDSTEATKKVESLINLIEISCGRSILEG